MVIIGKFTKAGNHIDIVLLEQELHALAHLLGHPATAFHHSLKIRSNSTVKGDAVISGM